MREFPHNLLHQHPISESISRESSLRHGGTKKSTSLHPAPYPPHQTVHIHKGAYVYMYTWSHVHRTHIYMCVICIGTHAHTYLMHPYLYAHMCKACTHMYILSWATAHVCSYTHTHTHTNLAVQENVFWFQVPAKNERKRAVMS